MIFAKRIFLTSDNATEYKKANIIKSKVLLIIARKQQMNVIINEVRSIDTGAFISVSSAMGVFGEGFEEVKSGVKLKKNDKIEEGK